MIRGKQRRPIETGAECFAPGIRAALVHLLEADVYARDVGANPWDFAVEIDDLMALGLTKGHLRWLIKKNYVQHAREVTKPKDSVRVFQSIQNLVFSKATCFILADAGRLLVKPDNTLSTGPRLFSTGDAATPAPVSVPHWDGGRRSLCVGGQLIKRYLVPSPTQEVILRLSRKRAGRITSTTRSRQKGQSSQNTVCMTRSSD